MTKFFFLYFTIFFMSINAQNKRDDILGKWMATDKSVAVQVYREGDDFKAKVIWFDKNLGSGTPIGTRVDSHNPDARLRNRKILGMDILEGLNYNADKKRWEAGKIYDASSGRTWDTYAEIQDDGKLSVRGFWKFKWIGKSIYFTRI